MALNLSAATQTAQLTLPEGGLAGFQYRRTDAGGGLVRFQLRNNGGTITCMGLPNNPEILTATFDESSLPGKVTIKLQGFAARQSDEME